MGDACADVAGEGSPAEDGDGSPPGDGTVGLFREMDEGMTGEGGLRLVLGVLGFDAEVGRGTACCCRREGVGGRERR